MVNRGRPDIDGLCLVVAGTFYCRSFILHVLRAKHPFVDLRLFLDRNFAVGVWFCFMFGLLLLTGIALMPPFLQNLLDYPVIVSGNVCSFLEVLGPWLR